MILHALQVGCPGPFCLFGHPSLNILLYIIESLQAKEYWNDSRGGGKLSQKSKTEWWRNDVLMIFFGVKFSCFYLFCISERKMDFQNRAGGKTGSGGQASWSDMNRDRRERLRQLALETIDLAKDPYFMKNHLGSYECKLCLTLHNNEGSYLAHTQVK